VLIIQCAVPCALVLMLPSLRLSVPKGSCYLQARKRSGLARCLPLNPALRCMYETHDGVSQIINRGNCIPYQIKSRRKYCDEYNHPLGDGSVNTA
jgi:hypothetical protein